MFEQYILPSYITDDYSDNFTKNQLAKEGIRYALPHEIREKALAMYAEIEEIILV